MKLETIYKCFLFTITNTQPTYWFSSFDKKYPMLYKWILTKTQALTNEDFDFRINTRVNWVLNDISDFPKCNYCHEYIDTWKHKNIPVTHKYPKYCKAHAHCNEEAIKHIKETLATFSDERWREISNKRENYCLNVYGYKNVSQIPEVIDQITTTISANYGVKRYSQTDSWYQKTIGKNNKNFGKDWYSQTNQYKVDVMNTLQTKYHENVSCAFQLSSVIEKINQKAYKKYRYDGKVFDSAPEVAFYIWLRDGGIKFVYQPYEKRITYYDQNGKQHIYQPDFYIIDTDQLIEIKGDQFFNNDGTMKNPYNSLYNESMELKHQCMIANNVKIMRNIDYQQYIKYVNYKYRKNFIKNLKYCK